MNRILKYIGTTLIMLLGSLGSFAQSNDNIVQVTGVAKSSDSLNAVPYLGVFVKNKSVGTITNDNGLFTLICSKGDTILLSGLGYQSKQIIIPKNLPGSFFNTIQYLVQDTFYLKEALVRPYPTPEEFDYAMRYKQYSDNIYDMARANTSREVLNMLLKSLRHDGGENAALYQYQQAIQATYNHQQAPVGIFNPLKWAEFFDAVKNGDFKKK